MPLAHAEPGETHRIDLRPVGVQVRKAAVIEEMPGNHEDEKQGYAGNALIMQKSRAGERDGAARGDDIARLQPADPVRQIGEENPPDEAAP